MNELIGIPVGFMGEAILGGIAYFSAFIVMSLQLFLGPIDGESFFIQELFDVGE